MIKLQDFLNAVQENANQVTEYVWGKSGDRGKCDCIGLIIGAVKRTGDKWNGLHGSNFAARSRTKDFRPISNQKDLKVGDLVFKHRKPGEDHYDLPDKYKPGKSSYNGDLNDYYHVGVVLSTNPLDIIHCTSGKEPIKHDTKVGKWSHHGSCTLVDDSDEQVVINLPECYLAVTFAESGSTVNMRKSNNSKADLLERVPIGSEVEVLEDLGEWSKVSYAGTDGYIKTEFLRRVNTAEGDYPSGETVTITLPRSIAVKVCDAFSLALGYGVG